jgi:hypothetical protein
MSHMGLGRRVKTTLGEMGLRLRSDQRLDPDDVHNPGQVREGHLGGHLWERIGQEVRRPQCGLLSCRTDVRLSPAAAAWLGS